MDKTKSERTQPNSFEFLNLDAENIDVNHLCCIIRKKKPHEGVEAKRAWLKERIAEGHVFRKLDVNACCFIEYAPLEKSWVPIIGDNYLYIYCLWTEGVCRGKGYGKSLMEYCIRDAKDNNRSGICMLGAKRQKNWLTNQEFAKKYGFKVVDETESGYELLALSFDGTVPKFSPSAKAERIESQNLTIYYSNQCPYIKQKVSDIQNYCEEQNIPLTLNHVDSLSMAKNLPCAFNNFAVFYKGVFETVNIVDVATIKKILAK